MRGREAVMVPALRADVMAGAFVGDVNLHHLVEARGGGAIFEDGDRGALLHPHQMTDHNV